MKKKWGLEFLRMLKPAKWKYKVPLNDGKVHFGLIAQDVDKVASRTDYGFVGFKSGYMTINYNEFVGPIIKAIQELDERLKKLEDRK